MAEFKLGFGIDKDLRIAQDLTELIGNTPMLKLSRYAKSQNIKSDIVAKLEYFNPLGSVKDRVALAMINEAEARGEINKDTVIIEPTSGNTGIGLCYISAIKGLKIIITMPENMSEERKKIMRSFGAELILTPAKDGMTGAIEKAKSLAESIENSYIPSQFTNMANPNIHKKTTGIEILRDTYGNIDYFVAGVGTGGTISGIGETLKAYNDNIKIIAVEPYDSAVLSGKPKGPHKISGIGAGFIPETLNTEIYDEILTVKNEEAYSTLKTVAKTEGLLIGISSAAALYASTEIAKRENKSKNIVCLMPDGGERYLSTDVFD